MAGTRAREAVTHSKRVTPAVVPTGVFGEFGDVPHPADALFDDQELLELAGRDGLARLNPGAPLLTEGDPVESVYLIRSGEVEVYRRTRGRRLVVQILHAGDLLGLVPHLRGRPARYSARAISSVQVLRLRPDAVSWLLQTRPSLSRRYIVYLVGHLERMAKRVEELSGGGLRARVASVLLDQAADGSGIIRLPQSTLADLLGASRSSVNRILKDMEARGMVRVRYRRVEILDSGAVRKVIR
jgi:CRP/FNR family transcriptional regulator, cAMP and macrophage regulator